VKNPAGREVLLLRIIKNEMWCVFRPTRSPIPETPDQRNVVYG
jgi:hypothetical protein